MDFFPAVESHCWLHKSTRRRKKKRKKTEERNQTNIEDIEIQRTNY